VDAGQPAGLFRSEPIVTRSFPMPRIHLLASALALAIVSTPAAQAQQFSNFVIFGDSLSDAGQYAGLIPGALRFTTNPDPVAAQLIGQQLGFTITASRTGGTDFAWGGAPTAAPFVCVPTTLPCRNVSQQIGDYFATSGGHADPHALYSMFVGANNIFNALANPPTAQATTIASAQQELGLINALQTAGAKNMLVWNLPDIGKTPDFRTSPFSGSITGLVLTYNGILNAGLGGKTGIISVDTFGLNNEILANPSLYGFTNVTDRACGATPSLFCTPASLVAPNANQTYLFADGVHPTGAGHALTAQYVVAEIQAPEYISMLAEAPLHVFESQTRALRDSMQSDMSRTREGGSLRTFASLDYSHQRYNATPTSPNTSSHNSTLTFGSDYYVNDAISVGLATSIGYEDASFGGGGGYRQTEPLVSAYGVWRMPNAYVSAQASVGQLNFNNIERSFKLGAATRIESGDTSGSHTGFELAGGYFFHWDDLKTGPFASISRQRVRVGSYSETTNDSGSMVFGRQSRNSTIAKIGWQLAGDSKMFDSSLHPFARVAYEHESDNNVRNVSAGLAGLNGTFSLPGFQPDSSWWSAELGLSADLGSNLVGYAAYSGRFGDSSQREDSINAGIKFSF
jgi:outer membrane lipase/esterase